VIWVQQLRRCLRLWIRPDGLEADLSEEVHLHVQMKMDDLVRHGWCLSAAHHVDHV